VDLIFAGGFKMSQRILCPTDLTVNSKDGIAYGLSLAKKNRAQLIIFHATLFPRLSQYACCEVEPYYPWSQLLSKFKTDQLLTEAEYRVRQFVCATFGAESSGVVWKPRAGQSGGGNCCRSNPGGCRSDRFVPAQKKRAHSVFHAPHR
jgi:hypothetical protein